jgi:hypothetical protein
VCRPHVHQEYKYFRDNFTMWQREGNCLFRGGHSITKVCVHHSWRQREADRIQEAETATPPTLHFPFLVRKVRAPVTEDLPPHYIFLAPVNQMMVYNITLIWKPGISVPDNLLSKKYFFDCQTETLQSRPEKKHHIQKSVSYKLITIDMDSDPNIS